MDYSYPKIALQGIDGLMFVKPNEIISAEADGNYTIVALSQNREIKVLRQIGEIEQLLDSGDSFIRIHRSNLINLEHVIRLDSDNESVLLSSGKSLAIARDRKMDFIEKFTRI